MNKLRFNREQLYGWSSDAVVGFFSNNRNKYNELYNSEKHFLTNKFLNTIETVLDVGCACGGFYNIFAALNKNICYTGIDVSEKSIKIACDKYFNKANVDFFLYSGKSVNEIKEIASKKFDLVFCSGLMHLIDNWQNIFREMTNKARNYVLADFRITEKESYIGKFYFDFKKEGNYKNSTNYHVININQLLDFLYQLEYAHEVSLYGYKSKPNELAVGIDEVFMVFIKLKIGEDRRGKLKVKRVPKIIKNHIDEMYLL